MSDNTHVHDGQDRVNKAELLALSGYGTVLGLGVVVLIVSISYFLPASFGYQYIIGTGGILAGSILVMIAFGGAYHRLQPRQ